LDSYEASGLRLDDQAQITTFGGTYYRWEVLPGVHNVNGAAPANESLTLSAEAGKIYFLEHSVRGTLRSGPQSTSLRQIEESYGRALVMRSKML
jgi:hypothetical protein